MNTSKKIQTQTRRKEIQSSEQTRIYHHELHRKSVKRKAILKLDTEEGMKEGHSECSTFLENQVRQLLEVPADLSLNSQEILLSEVSQSITEKDNKMFEALPTK